MKRGFIRTGWFFAAVMITSRLFAQSNLQSPLNISGSGGFRLDFGISDSCPGGTTSAPGMATICGNNNNVTLSVNGAPAFTLSPGQPGPAGPVGPAGAAGAQGLVGPQGPVGPTGAVGPQGSRGPAGPSGATGQAGSVGPVGPEGPQGQAGQSGPQGPIGPAGPQGIQGIPGVAAAPIDYTLVGHPGLVSSGTQSWVMPNAVTELFGDVVRVQADLSAAARARVYVQIGNSFGAPGTIVFCEYSLDGGNSWHSLTKAASVSSTGANVSPWTMIPALGKADVLVRAVSSNGTNSSVDVEAVHLQVK